jgi:hypothetical protein
MAKGSGVIYPTSTKKNTSLSKQHMPMRQGKMTRSHGVTNGGGKHKTLINASGAVGSGAATMNKNFEHPSQCIDGNKSKLYNK